MSMRVYRAYIGSKFSFIAKQQQQHFRILRNQQVISNFINFI